MLLSVKQATTTWAISSSTSCANNIPTDHVTNVPRRKSPVSSAFLNNRSDAEYIFYKDYPQAAPDVGKRIIRRIMGRTMPWNPVLRDKVVELLERAHDMHAIIYYDPNFRSSHKRRPSSWLPPSSRIWNTPTLYAARKEDFLLYVGPAGGRQDIQKTK